MAKAKLSVASVPLVATITKEDGSGEWEYADNVAVERDNSYSTYHIQELCRQVISLSGLVTPRSQRQKVSVRVWEMRAVNGKMSRIGVGNYVYDLPVARMTQEEYDQELSLAVSELPDEFHSFVRQWAWEHGHSSGFEEVIQIAQNLVSELKPAVHKCLRAHS